MTWLRIERLYPVSIPFEWKHNKTFKMTWPTCIIFSSGRTRRTTCLVFYSWYLWYSLLRALRRRYCCVTSIYVQRWVHNYCRYTNLALQLKKKEERVGLIIGKIKMSRLMIKQTKWHVCPAKTQPNLIRVFAVRIMKAWVLSYPLSKQRRFWSDWWMHRLISVFAGCTVILLVLSWCLKWSRKMHF